MKPLNRPMFRYGGPIKEGVMSGIREPKKDGGMLLVGEHPKEFRDAGGREKHVAPIVYGAGLGLARLAPLAMRGARALKGLFGSRKFVKDVGTKIASSKNTAPFTPVKQIFEPNKVGRYIMGSPEYRLITGGAGYAGKAGKKLFEGGKYLAKSPLTVGGGLIYVGGKFFNKDGTPASADAIAKSKASDGGPPGGGDPSMFATPKETSMPQLTAEERRAKNVERYRDIMDIKGMNKDAAYNSLIAASQAINESGDFKGDIKSGKLINQIIQATSKQFDKPKATKDAIDTLILKGEIEKDIKASDPTAKQKARLTEKQIAIADKSLAGDSFSDIITERYKKGKVPRGSELAGILRATEKVDVTTIDSTKIPSGVDPQTFFESEIQESIKAGTPVNPGYYVISDRVLIVDEQGNVTPLL